jgi:hypothetical protein
MAPLVIRLTGLSEVELPTVSCKSGILVCEVPGLCVGGAVDPRTTACGYIVFTRCTKGKKDESPDQKFFAWYYKNIYRQFIADQRKAYFGWKEKSPVDIELTAASWNDGDIPQLAACGAKDMLNKYLRERICCCKQNVARTRLEQAADLMRVFPIVKALLKSMTLKEQSTPLKDLINRKLDEYQRIGKLCLPRPKRNAIVDLVACSPTVLAISMHACQHSERLRGEWPA